MKKAVKDSFKSVTLISKDVKQLEYFTIALESLTRRYWQGLFESMYFATPFSYKGFFG